MLRIKAILTNVDDDYLNVVWMMAHDHAPLRHVGEMHLKMGMWQLFGTALSIGCDDINKDLDRIDYSVEGESEALNPE